MESSWSLGRTTEQGCMSWVESSWSLGRTTEQGCMSWVGSGAEEHRISGPPFFFDLDNLFLNLVAGITSVEASLSWLMNNVSLRSQFRFWTTLKDGGVGCVLSPFWVCGKSSYSIGGGKTWEAKFISQERERGGGEGRGMEGRRDRVLTCGRLQLWPASGGSGAGGLGWESSSSVTRSQHFSMSALLGCWNLSEESIKYTNIYIDHAKGFADWR